MPHYIVGLDAGTSKIAVAVARASDKEDLTIVGFAVAESRGLRRGEVLNPHRATDSILQAVNDAKLIAGIAIEEVYLGLSGPHVKGRHCRGISVVENRDRVITGDDVRRVTDRAMGAEPLGPGREVLHALPVDFVLDGQDGITDPVALTIAPQSEANLYLVTNRVSYRNELTACVQAAGLTVLRSIAGTLAAGEAGLTADERELGVAMVDIGAGSTHIAIFERGRLHYINDIAVGGGHFTNDLVLALCVPVAQAERVKRTAGSVLPERIASDETVNIHRSGFKNPRIFPRAELACVLQKRAEELFRLVNASIVASGCRQGLFAGVVLTGGGALLTRIPEIAERVLDLPVRHGHPTVTGQSTPHVDASSVMTAEGLVRYAHRQTLQVPRLAMLPRRP